MSKCPAIGMAAVTGADEIERIKQRQRREQARDHRELDRDGVDLDALDRMKAAPGSDDGDDEQNAGHDRLGDLGIRDAEGFQKEGREQHQVVGDRHEIGEREREVGEALGREHRLGGVAVLQQRLDVGDVVANGGADEIGDDEQADHWDHRPLAHHVAQDRHRHEKARADDGGERGGGSAPVVGRDEARAQQQKERTEADEKRDGRKHDKGSREIRRTSPLPRTLPANAQHDGSIPKRYSVRGSTLSASIE